MTDRLETIMDDLPPSVPRSPVPLAANDKGPRSLGVVLEHERWAAQDKRPRFEIYRSEQVSLTSVLFAGGDWHWRLMDADGKLLADCGGFKAEGDCRKAVVALRDVAGQAFIPGRVQDIS